MSKKKLTKAEKKLAKGLFNAERSIKRIMSALSGVRHISQVSFQVDLLECVAKDVADLNVSIGKVEEAEEEVVEEVEAEEQAEEETTEAE